MQSVHLLQDVCGRLAVRPSFHYWPHLLSDVVCQGKGHNCLFTQFFMNHCLHNCTSSSASLAVVGWCLIRFRLWWTNLNDIHYFPVLKWGVSEDITVPLALLPFSWMEGKPMVKLHIAIYGQWMDMNSVWTWMNSVVRYFELLITQLKVYFHGNTYS